MKKQIQITIALLLGISALGLQAFDETVTDPWAPKKNAIKLAGKRVKLGNELYGAYGDVYGDGPTYKQPWNPAYRYDLEDKIRMLERGPVFGRLSRWIASVYASPYERHVRRKR